MFTSSLATFSSDGCTKTGRCYLVNRSVLDGQYTIVTLLFVRRQPLRLESACTGIFKQRRCPVRIDMGRSMILIDLHIMWGALHMDAFAMYLHRKHTWRSSCCRRGDEGMDGKLRWSAPCDVLRLSDDRVFLYHTAHRFNALWRTKKSHFHASDEMHMKNVDKIL